MRAKRSGWYALTPAFLQLEDRTLPVNRRPVVRSADGRSRLLLQALEGRIAPATFTVSNSNDSGTGSLRQAIFYANSIPGADTIVFDSTPVGTAPSIRRRA
jgi:hypothetical protein